MGPLQRATLLAMALDRRRLARGALAGGAAAAAWALQQPLDQRAFRCRYDDVELLGRLVTGRRRGWRPVGVAMHVANGALFGAAYTALAPALPGPPALRGSVVALAEHLALWPLGRLSDRRHPARDLLPQLTGNRAAFWQAAWRHALFGSLLGTLEHQLNGGPGAGTAAATPDAAVAPARSNGRGDLARAAVSHERG
jgi:hypothetical protein